MPVEGLGLRAKMLREELRRITSAPDDKSINQLREEAIVQTLSEVAEEARLKAIQEEIYAVGKSPEEAISALATFKGWGEVTDMRSLDSGDEKYTWGRRFCVNGTSMKAAGWDVHGGVVLTWWK